MRPITSPDVAAVFNAYPSKLRRKLLVLRDLILETAEATEGIGELQETLKWGEPAYLPVKRGIGTTVRIDWKKAAPLEYALCFHCQTNLVEQFRAWFPRELRFDGNRRIVFAENDDVPLELLSVCIAAALTYHRDKKRRSSQ